MLCGQILANTKSLKLARGRHVIFVWHGLIVDQVTDEGTAKAFAWSAYGGHYAALDIVYEIVVEKRKRTNRKDTEKAVGKRVLRVGVAGGEKRELPVPFLQNVAGIIGGPLLGVQTYTGDQTAPPLSAVTLQFYDWATGQPIGPSIPSPRTILADVNQEFCVLAYETWFSVHSLVPFRSVCKCPHPLTSATWVNRSLIYTTPTDIRIMFPHAEDTNPVTLFSFSLLPSVPSLALYV